MNAVGKRLCALALAAFATGCDGGGTDASVATTVTATSATPQTAVAGGAVAQAPAVRVLDQRGDAMAGVSVVFAASGNGTIASSTATTDAGGNASAGGWTLGPTVGTQTVTATVGSLAPVTFTATAQARAATTLVATSPAAQTGLAGSAVAQAPSVQVKDQLGEPLAGVPVTFAVTAGGGQVVFAVYTTNVTGLATSGYWTLGAVGENAVTASVAGVTPVQFTATAQARVPTTMTRLSPDGQLAVPGTAVSSPPSVVVADQAGRGMAGVAVTFAVTAGGGTLTGPTAITSESGVASAGSWTLGPAPGENVVTATAAGLAPVQIHATGQVYPVVNIVPVSATSQSAPVGTEVPEPPSVRVEGQGGQALAGVPVTFTVTAGGGTVTGGTATTNQYGVATAVRWTLGPVEGPNTLTATTGSLSPVVFNATGTPGGDPCTMSVTYTAGATLNGSLATTDCRLSSGHYADFYNTSLPTATAVEYQMNSTAVDSWLEMYDAAGNLVAFNDDAATGTSDSKVRVFAPSGNYFLAASSYEAGETGAYQIRSFSLLQNTNCDMHWVVPGVTVQGSLNGADCNDSGYLSDGYYVVLRPGQTLTVGMQSTAVDAWLGLYSSNGSLVQSEDGGGSGNDALLVYPYTGSTTAVFYIDAGTSTPGETGAYTLTVTRTGTTTAAVSAAPRAGRPVPAGIVRQPRAPLRTMIPAAKAGLQRGPARTPSIPRAKRAAPRG
jgi:hypothetical protein